ncbi:DUF599 domain-containing protein [Shimia haliotis]|uniref:Uncharacterized membrane protein n=1 Tax=Shimia haliotis TaxID=1280847 RepID=A0A1I4DLA7_9RHOB|nr:DUF599 domain-containing protein [Shimia haliotis]SFK92691.1 Uncharacterized membrane protein [Shimia haliotis]
MLWNTISSLFTPFDIAALVLMVVGWLSVGFIIENPPLSRPSVSQMMGFYRREWMLHLVDRNTRVFDAQIVGNLRQSTAFFASTSMIAIGGLIALMGNAAKISGIARDLTQVPESQVEIELKLAVILIFLANAFLKFVWSHRLFGYCAILVASVPNDVGHPSAVARAQKAGTVNVTASRSFNRGLRSVYFAMACLAWLFGAGALMAATVITVIVLARREFASQSRAALLQEPR